VVTSRPWFYQTTMHGIFMLVGNFVSVSGTYNKKLRRARGL